MDVDVCLLQNKARKALLKSSIQKWFNLIDKYVHLFKLKMHQEG